MEMIFVERRYRWQKAKCNPEQHDASAIPEVISAESNAVASEDPACIRHKVHAEVRSTGVLPSPLQPSLLGAEKAADRAFGCVRFTDRSTLLHAAVGWRDDRLAAWVTDSIGDDLLHCVDAAGLTAKRVDTMP
eukprot:1047912-Amphidinium_carterae.1